MRQPEYFIEVWKEPTYGRLINDDPQPFNYLRASLDATNEMNAETIAIWKIYPKTP